MVGNLHLVNVYSDFHKVAGTNFEDIPKFGNLDLDNLDNTKGENQRNMPQPLTMER